MADGAIRDILERSIDDFPDGLCIVFVACVIDGLTPEHFAELFAFTSESVEERCATAAVCWLKRL